MLAELSAGIESPAQHEASPAICVWGDFDHQPPRKKKKKKKAGKGKP
jgi:hypothetical protein